ncbi:MAG: AMP-binding protein [Bacteroidota bacterium]
MMQHPWHESYPDTLKKEIDPDSYETLLNIFDEAIGKFKDKIAYVNMDASITYGDLDRLSDEFAAYIQNKTNLKPGDKLAIQMPNLFQYPVVLFGALKAGLTVVNINPLYTPREMEHQFNDSGSKGIVIIANFAHNLEKVLHNTQIETVIVTEIGDLLGGFKGWITNFVVKNIKKMVPSYSLPRAIKFKDVLKEGAKNNFQRPEIKSEDVAFLQYTGGTTGVSKGAVLTHRNIISNVLQTEGWLLTDAWGLETGEGNEVVITALPIYHIFALTVNCISMLKVGAKNILITNPRDIPAFVKELNKYPFTIITAVNTLFNGLLNNEEFKNVNFKNLKISVGGGMAVQKAVATEWQEVTGCPLAEGYGLSETSPLLCCNPLDGNQKTGTIGLPVASTEIKIFDDDGKEVEKGTPGEICAKGPQVMKGYWNRPEETAKVFHDDWFKTGDIGLFTGGGFIKIVDRKKDMILVSGFNVYPNEVEDAVAAHPKVLEVASIGVPHPKSNEAVKIFVVKKDESLTEEELSSFCKENLTGYKCPRYIEFREELPKTNVGKILRRKLKDEEEAKRR